MDEQSEENQIATRRKALKLSQKKLAALVDVVTKKEAGKPFTYQSLQKIEAGGQSRYMVYLLRVLEDQERRKALGHNVPAEKLTELELLRLAKRHESVLRLFDALEVDRQKYILSEINSQMAKQAGDASITTKPGSADQKTA